MARIHTKEELEVRRKVLAERPTNTTRIENKLTRKIRELENLQNS